MGSSYKVRIQSSEKKVYLLRLIYKLGAWSVSVELLDSIFHSVDIAHSNTDVQRKNLAIYFYHSLPQKKVQAPSKEGNYTEGTRRENVF